MPEAVIVEAVRTPIGKRNGSLADIHPTDLGATVLRELARRTGIDPAEVDDVQWGCVGQIGDQSSNVGRFTVLAAGWPESVPAVIVDETFAKTYFPSQAAIGQVIEIGGEASAEIVGVVRDSKIDTLGEAPKSVVYYPFAQRPRRLTVITRTSGDPALAAPTIRAAV